MLEFEHVFDFDRAKGTWSMPEKIAGGLGRLHFPHHLREDGSFFPEWVGSGAHGPISTAASPEAQ